MTGTTYPNPVRTVPQDTTVCDLLAHAGTFGVEPSTLLDRDRWASETEVDDLFGTVTHSTRYNVDSYSIVLSHTFYGREDLGRDVMVQWSSFDTDGRACTQEEFAVNDRDLDGLITALQNARARLREEVSA